MSTTISSLGINFRINRYHVVVTTDNDPTQRYLTHGQTLDLLDSVKAQLTLSGITKWGQVLIVESEDE